MELEDNNKSATCASNEEQRVSFPQVTVVVTRWTLDFLFVSLCRYFKEDKLDEFNDTLSNYEAISQSPPLKEATDDEKIRICAFLARVMHGKQLDVMFEEDKRVIPLMSAAKIWSDLEDTVADKSLFKNVTVLLLVQSVAVCLEKGQRSSAYSALKWFEENHAFPKSLRVQLSAVVTERETYHPLLVTFSFSRLRETIQSYLDEYLEKNPSDYLLKEATKVAQSQQNAEDLEDEETLESTRTEMSNDSTDDTKKKKNTGRVRTKRKLLSTKITDVWKPDSCKKAVVSIRRISDHELLKMSSEKSFNTSKMEKTRKARRKWTKNLDQKLKDGVKRHGKGNWSRILLDHDFGGRTGTMLKDRWRILLKAREVS
ncbi:telomeric repeat-binding factor 1 [Labrus bergylta]|uniref:telomeric repeat-binding factor 1 n=1 Tax=Labrus bergylta TaxID=56723 RepID=UPI003313CFD2